MTEYLRLTCYVLGLILQVLFVIDRRQDRPKMLAAAFCALVFAGLTICQLGVMI